MPFEEEYTPENETLQSVNLQDNTNSDDSGGTPNTPNNSGPSDGGDLPNLNNQGQVVSIQTQSIQVGSDIYAPNSQSELNELVQNQVITEQQRNIFQQKYEAWHGELPLQPLEEEEDDSEGSEETVNTSGLVNNLAGGESGGTDVGVDVNPETMLAPPTEQLMTTNTEEGISTGMTGESIQNSPISLAQVMESQPQGVDIPELPEHQKKPLATPETDQDFQQVQQSVMVEGDKEQEHNSPNQDVEDAQKAALAPTNERQSLAEANQVDKMNEQEAQPFNGAQFKSLLMSKIKSILPKDEEEASEFKNNNKIGQVKSAASGQVNAEKQKSAGNISGATKETPNTSNVQGKEVTPLPQMNIGSGPKDIKASTAMPKPFEESEVEQPLQQNSEHVDKFLEDNEITDEQLQKANEPEFKRAYDEKEKVKQDSQEAPQAVRQEEQSTLQSTQQQAQTQGQQDMMALHGDRTRILGDVQQQQVQTGSEDTAERTRISGELNAIYNKTKTDVEGILSQLDTRVKSMFDAAAKRAKNKFEQYVDKKMTAYKEERYDGITGKLTWVGDAFTGLPDEVNAFFMQGRSLYIAEMEKAITQIANLVAQQLNAAKQRIVSGKQEIQRYVDELPDNLKEIGKDAASSISAKFEELDQQVNDKQNSLIDDLSQQYKTALESVDQRIEEMKAANRGLVDIAMDAVGGVISVVKGLRDMLTKMVGAAVDAIGAILADPIGFLGNLITGVGQGFQKFGANISKHLPSGLVTWLTGAMSGVGIQMPQDVFSLEGIFSLVTQSLGLTWDYVREKAVKLMGERAVATAESSFEIFSVLREKGIGGAWEHLQEQFADLKDTVMGAISQMLITQVVQAGIKWVLGLLTPAGAFVKAAMMIINIVEFFVNQGSRIVELVNAFIASISALATGSVGKVAELIERALALSIPVLIDFLAKLLGVGKVADKVQEIFGKVRGRIDKAIDGFILKAQKWFKDKKGRRQERRDRRKEEREQDKDEQDGADNADNKTKVKTAIKEGAAVVENEEFTDKVIQQKLEELEKKHKLQDLSARLQEETAEWHTYHLQGKLGNTRKSKTIKRKPTKAENEEEVNEEDRKKHEILVQEVETKLHTIASNEAPKDKVETFEEFYKRLQNEAQQLEQQNQSKLRKGIKIDVDLINSLRQDESDGDVDIKIHIYPNAKKKHVNVKQKNINKQGDHIFNSNLKIVTKKLVRLLTGVSGLEELTQAFNSASATFSQYPFDETVPNTGVVSGGDANSKAYGRTKQQLLSRFELYVQQRTNGEHADPSGLDSLVAKWLDVAYDSDAIPRIADKKTKQACVRARNNTVPAIRDNIIAQIPAVDLGNNETDKVLAKTNGNILEVQSKLDDRVIELTQIDDTDYRIRNLTSITQRDLDTLKMEYQELIGLKDEQEMVDTIQEMCKDIDNRLNVINTIIEQ